MIVSDLKEVKNLYREAARRGWVLPCFCSENLTTTESILAAAAEHGRKINVNNIPVIIAITCHYSHRSQAAYYTHTRSVQTGLQLFFDDIRALADQGAPYEDLQVMIHLDHIQHDLDRALLESDLSDFSSIMYDASALPLEENIRLTADFVQERGKDILIEGACDEIQDAEGDEHSDLTTPEVALRYLNETGVDLVVANLGTEHRAAGQELQYQAQAARNIKKVIGPKIVLHGLSSVPHHQIRGLFQDGICKANIWTTLERDSSPVLFAEMVKNAVRVAGAELVEKLVQEGYLTEKCVTATGSKLSLDHFTTAYRSDIIHREMKKIVKSYFEMWYI